MSTFWPKACNAIVVECQCNCKQEIRVCAVMALAGDVVSAIPTKVYDMRVFFSKSRLSLQKWLLLMPLWSRDCPVTDAAREAQITEKSAIQMYQCFRDVCSWRLVNYDPPIALGGTGIVVSIDESQFCHKVKVNKPQRGDPAPPPPPPPPPPRINHVLVYSTLSTLLLYSITEEELQLQKYGIWNG